HPQESIDPARDAAAMELELEFADAAFIEKRLERIEASMRSVKMSERDAAEREVALLTRLKRGLEAEVPLRHQEIASEDQKLLVNYQFLTDKPLLIVINIDDDEAARTAEIEAAFAPRAHAHTVVAAISGKIEQELAQLSEDEAVEFRNDL